MLADMKSYSRILLIVGVIVVAALGIWKLTGTPAAPEQTGDIPTPSIVPLASVSPLVMAYDAAPADWKAYATASFPFTVSYPADWTVGPCAPGCLGWTPPTGASNSFALGIIEQQNTMEELLASAEPYMAAKEEVTVGANTWLKLTLQHPMSGDVITSHFIAHNGKLYEFGTASQEPDIIAVYGSMIRSLVFTK